MRILILEDDALIALDLQCLLEDAGHHVLGPFATIAAARAGRPSAIDFAFLDIDLPDGKSFAFAAQLERERVPFAFVSASARSDLPETLRHARFVAKPYAHAAIRSFLGETTRLAS